MDDHERNDEGWGEDGKRYYNVYSLPLVKEFLESLGLETFDTSDSI